MITVFKCYTCVIILAWMNKLKWIKYTLGNNGTQYGTPSFLKSVSLNYHF